MDASKDDGGSAFPPSISPNYKSLIGMSLRDYYAGQAIKLFPLSQENIDQLQSGKAAPNHAVVAKFCCDLADALIKELAK